MLMKRSEELIKIAEEMAHRLIDAQVGWAAHPPPFSAAVRRHNPSVIFSAASTSEASVTVRDRHLASTYGLPFCLFVGAGWRAKQEGTEGRGQASQGGIKQVQTPRRSAGSGSRTFPIGWVRAVDVARMTTCARGAGAASPCYGACVEVSHRPSCTVG